MTTLETKFESANAQADEAVFVARDGRRARRLRNAAIVVGVLAILWIVGLGVGMLGFGGLPGVALVKGARADSRTARTYAILHREGGHGPIACRRGQGGPTDFGSDSKCPRGGNRDCQAHGPRVESFPPAGRDASCGSDSDACQPRTAHSRLGA